MIIFAITTNIEFIKKPNWLDSFCNKHNKIEYEFHITLKQPCIIQENQIVSIQNIISEYILKKASKQIEIDLNKLYIDASESALSISNGCIMIEAEKSDDIKKLQKELVEVLSDYKDYQTPKVKSYEENFKPHITIASDLNKEEFELAEEDLQDDFMCQGKITKLYLIIVHNFDPEKKNGDKQTITYSL